jgi:ABC-2 type transport system permease protein
MGKYLEYFRISFLTILAYRARYYVGIATYLIYIALNTAVWGAVFRSSEGQDLIGGFTLPQLTTWIAVGWLCRSFMFNNLDRDIEIKVVDGSLAMDLLKPMDFQGMQYARVLGEGLFRLVLFASPTAIFAYPLFGVAGPASLVHLVAFSGSLLLGALIFMHINFLVGSLAIPLRNLEGISYAKNNLLLFLTGLLIPYGMLPDWAASVLRALPFAGISDTPLRIYLGQVPVENLPKILGFQAAWCVGMFIVARGFWGLMIRRVVIQGG